MKNLIFAGVLLLGVSFLLYNLMPEFSPVRFFEPISLMGMLAGIGIGLIIGGVIGYISKGSAIREEKKRQEFKRLLEERAILQKQAEEQAKKEEALRQESVLNNDAQNNF
ncbi:MAG: hypothetical protein ITF99_01290 [Chryseobacterium sp.]|nr:hypothetical protein [Chryseobacterium sp.]